jgi:NADPH-dependent glutamate synthase beta subunit-like oxidoreductase
MTIENERQPFSFEEVINYTIKEAKEALNDPYQFKKPIKNVAVIGAGPSGVKYSK